MKRKINRAPLRKIIAVTRYAESMFDKNYVVFECGHTGTATENAIRGRCKDCEKQSQPSGVRK